MKSGLEEGEFWKSVRAEILHYQASFPHLKKRFELFDFYVQPLRN